MPNPNALVARVVRLDPPMDRQADEMIKSERGLSVELEDGRRARLDPENAKSAGFAQILDGLRQKRLHVYLEVDPETSAITRLLIPLVTRVLGFRTIDDGVLGVELELSHARHVLREDQPDHDEMEGQLRDALVSAQPIILTEDDAHNIVDVRFFEPGPGGPPRRFPRPDIPLERPWWRLIRELVIEIVRWPWWPWWWFRCPTPAYAQQVFNDMAATSCNPLTVPPPCIPFLYPDDGCWARAHEMCRLMINMGLSPKKVWIQGTLYVSTKNNPACGVHWNWHVASTLCVRGPGLFQTQRMVIDPALFTTPVTQAMWKGVQGDPSATLTPSNASIYYLWSSITDPTYAQTNQKLDYYRSKLQTRSVNEGPPPYASCP